MMADTDDDWIAMLTNIDVDDCSDSDDRTDFSPSWDHLCPLLQKYQFEKQERVICDA